MNDLKDLLVNNLKFVVASAVVAGATYFLLANFVFEVQESNTPEDSSGSVVGKALAPSVSKTNSSAPELQSQVEVVSKKAGTSSQEEKPDLPLYKPEEQGGAGYSVASNRVNTAEYEEKLNNYYDRTYQDPVEIPYPKKKEPETINPVLASFFDTSVLEKKIADDVKKKSDELGSGGGETSGTVLSVTADQPAGTYSSAPDVTLTFLVNSQPSTEGTIFYCIKEGGDCCESDAVTSTYTAPVALGTDGDGKYCLSFYGKSFSGLSTLVSDLRVTIDSTLPNKPLTATETYYTQTTERFSFRFPQVSYAGSASGTILSFYALHTDPGANPNCEQVAHDYPALNLDGVAGPDYIDFMAYLLQPVDLLLFYYNFNPSEQDYFIVSTVTKIHVDKPLSNCSVTSVVVEDFPFFSTLPIKQATAPAASRKMLGTFTPFGFFKPLPATTDQSGKGKERELHSGFMHSIF